MSVIKRFINRMFCEYDNQSLRRQIIDAFGISIPMIIAFAFQEPWLMIAGCSFMIIMVQAKGWYDNRKYRLKILMIEYPGENLKILEKMEK